MVPGDRSSFKLLGETKGTVSPGDAKWTRFDFPAMPPGDAKFIWIQLPRTAGVTWRLADKSRGAVPYRAWCGKEWTFVSDEVYALVPEGGLRFAVADVPEPGRVIDGVSRNAGGVRHGWISDPAQKLPQTLTLDFGRPVAAREVRLTFDPNLNPLHPRGNPLPPTLVKAYAVEAFDGSEWITLATETRNTVRHRVHKFQSRTVTAVRIRIDETWGDPSARIFEVRVY